VIDATPPPDQADRRMKRLVSLSLCLSLSLFAVARAMKQSPTLAVVVKTAQEKNESFHVSDAGEQEAAAEEDTDQEAAPAADNSIQDVSEDEGEDMADDDASADDNGGEGDSGDDDGGNDGGDDDGN
jgi:hypothetical protein